MISVFEPETCIYPNTAIVMANGFAGSVEGNFGRTATQIAHLTGALVLAYDRIGTGQRTVFALTLRNQLRPNRVVQRVAHTGRTIHVKLDAYDVDNVISFGQSGGAPEAVALTRSKELPVIGLGISEPVAIQKMPTLKGVGTELLYDFRHERPARKRAAQDLARHVKPTEVDNDTEGVESKYRELSRKQKLGRTLLEVYYYSALWPTTFTLDALKEIGTEQTDVALYAAFAGKSLNGNARRIRDIVDQISRYRHMTLTKPFQAEIWPKTLHSAFDKPDVASKVIQRTIALAGIEPS